MLSLWATAAGDDGAAPIDPSSMEAFRRNVATEQPFRENPDSPKLIFAVPQTGEGPPRHARNQPQGVLSGRLLFIGAGHGWTYGDQGALVGEWFTQRGNTGGVVEDYGNQDQMSIFASYLWNAGATIIPYRPIGRQPIEIVLDQDDTAAGADGVVQYTGTWSMSSGTPGYLKAPDSATDNYRFATTTGNASASATAKYLPNITKSDFYPVYTWVRNGTDRIQQEYIVHHAGGDTSVRINHRAVGKGWIWLGTYWFEQGGAGSVTITNVKLTTDTTGGNVVIADAIRFGNGMGSLSFAPSNDISGFPRENECSRYWAMISQAPQSVWDGSDTHQNDNVGTPPRFAAYMNDEAFGVQTDRVYLSFHTNAAGGRGALGLFNTATSTTTIHQEALADFVGREVNEDFQQLDTLLFPSYAQWTNTTTHKLDRTDIDFGEIRRDSINDEMDATINEVAYHDNASDQRYLSDARGRRLIARSTMEGLIRYFNAFGGGALAFPPDEPTNLRAINAADGTGDIVLTWSAPVVRTSAMAGTPGSLTGDAPTGYTVYSSANGKELVPLAEVNGGATTTYRASSLTAGASYYFEVVAKNAAGVSFPSNLAGATSRATRPQVLIVDGFDRLDDTNVAKQTVSGLANRSNLGTFNRVVPDLINNFTYVGPTGRAVAAASKWNAFDSCTNDAMIAGSVSLGSYKAVIWILGEETTVDETFNATEQARVTSFLASGGDLLVSGTELALDLDNQGAAADKTFINGTLHAGYVGNDAGTYNVVGNTGTIFDGLSLTFDNGTNTNYDAEAPDRLSALTGATALLRYSGGTGDNAGISFDGSGGGTGKIIALGFPLETITSEASRLAMMNTTLNWFAEGEIVPGDANGNGTVTATDAQLIFECYLNGHCPSGVIAEATEVCPPAGSPTPTDAQGAFNVFLGLPACP